MVRIVPTNPFLTSSVTRIRCYEVASVGWMSRSIAKAVFAAPPESSYEEVMNVAAE